MKLFIAAFAFILFLSSCSTEKRSDDIFSFIPEKPEAGNEVTIFYLADSSNLKNAGQVEMVAYFYSVDLNETKFFKMKKNENGWESKITIPDSTKGIIVKFINEDEFDNNKKSGYFIPIFNDGKILPGSRAGYGYAVYNWGSYYLELDRDLDLAEAKMKEDFKENPEIKNDYLDLYFEIIDRKPSALKDSIIKSEIAQLEKIDNKNEKIISLLAEGYLEINDTLNSDVYKNILEEKYPKNKFLEEEKYREIQNETDIKKKLELVKKFETQFPESELIVSAYDQVWSAYRKQKKYKESLEFLTANQYKPRSHRFYTLAYDMLQANADINTALQIANLGVERNRKEVNNPPEKPVYFTEKEWDKERKLILGLTLYVQGDALYRLNKKEEALASVEEAVEFTESSDAEINELYAKILLETGNYDKALSSLEKFIKVRKSSAKMNEYLKEAYIKKNGSEKDFDKYIAQFESAAKELMKEELRKKIINEPAPDFILTDLDGNKVSLSDFKGKTVLLDFWATWCGPCLSSFPAMKTAVEKSDKNNVKYLFINSWERVDNKLENAKDFISKNKYPFHVLMDTENEVITKYKVSGIPTKFIIDKNGNIRFISIGYSGNNDKMIEELNEMFAMVN